MKKISVALIIALVLAAILSQGHGSLEPASGEPDTGFSRDDRLNHPEKMPAVSISVLKTGEVSSREALFVSGGSWLKARTGIHSAILIQHPKGNFLFDSGLGNHIDEQYQSAMPAWLKPAMKYRKIQSAQELLAGQPRPVEISMMMLSHLHWDHAGGIKDFPNAEVWTTETEYRHAIDRSTPEHAFIKSQFDGDNVKWHFIRFKDTPYENFEESLDVFNDGSIILVPLDGHTPGSIGMFINLRSGKRLFFTGDTTWTLEGFQKPAHKHWVPSLLADDDRNLTAQTIMKIRQLMDHYPDLIVVPAHDETVQQRIGMYPLNLK